MFSITHGVMKQVLLFILVVVMILQSSSLAATACEQGDFFLIQYIDDDTAYQPFAVSNDALFVSTVDWRPFFHYGSPPTEVYSYLSPILIDNNRVIGMDVSEKRVALLCSDVHDNVFLRIAIWDDVSLTYEKIDTLYLPLGSYMDSYHDGNSILLSIPLTTDITGAEDEEIIGESLFLTFEQRENEWVLVCFTDGGDYAADLCGTEYIFNNYYEPSDAYEWRSGGPILLKQFDFTELTKIIGAYNMYFAK